MKWISFHFPFTNFTLLEIRVNYLKCIPYWKKTRIRFHTLKTYVFLVYISSLQLLSKMHRVQRCTGTIVPAFSSQYSVLRKSLWYTESKHQAREGLGQIYVSWYSKFRVLTRKCQVNAHEHSISRKKESNLWVTHSSKMCTYFRVYFRKALPRKGFSLSVKKKKKPDISK